MNWIRRAVLYNARKKGKTLLLFLLLLVIGMLLLTCFSIQRATKTAALNVRQSLKGAFYHRSRSVRRPADGRGAADNTAASGNHRIQRTIRFLCRISA